MSSGILARGKSFSTGSSLNSALSSEFLMKAAQSVYGKHPDFENMPPCIGNRWLRKDPHGSLKAIQCGQLKHWETFMRNPNNTTL
jgi:hypothetical protein